MLSRLPDLQQSFSPTTKKAPKIQNAGSVMDWLYGAVKPGLRACIYAVQCVAALWSNIFMSASCCDLDLFQG